VLSTVQREMEMATRRSKLSFSRQDSRLSVKTLIESIENNKAVSPLLDQFHEELKLVMSMLR